MNQLIYLNLNLFNLRLQNLSNFILKASVNDLEIQHFKSLFQRDCHKATVQIIYTVIYTVRDAV